VSAQSPGWSAHPWVQAGQGRIRFGIHVGPFPQLDVTIEWVQLVEELGFDSFWLLDHPGRASEDTWTYLAALAVSTKRIRLGTLVNCVYYRTPTTLALCAADVDRLSNGRLVLGVGAGWDRDEFAQLGLAFPPARDRLAALDETIQIVAGLWGDSPFTFQGRHFQVTNGHTQKGPIQTPRVPLLVGGGGEKVTLRLVAQYADMANVDGFFLPSGEEGLAEVRRKNAALTRHCIDRGRAVESVIRSYHAITTIADSRRSLDDKLNQGAWPAPYNQFPLHIAGTPDEVIAQYRSLVDAGMGYFTVAVRDEETLRLLARNVVPVLGG
jgi:alkanesulfonate monooxygenase SsuD/methylene tetrahydromethanopterin reductase-like flavin-dependent oxidoreductase (luciferase family)